VAAALAPAPPPAWSSARAEAFGFDDARIAALPGLKAAAGEVADAFFERPSAALDVLAVTGTNGKTSTAWWTAQALTRAGPALRVSWARWASASRRGRRQPGRVRRRDPPA
jgi:UDP-N-acetylmuramoyl-L-alanyl-D-glutamate--2,6-diaminopimelate ligase